jgi:hypothetical protein
VGKYWSRIIERKLAKKKKLQQIKHDENNEGEIE